MNDVREFELIVSQDFDFGALEVSRDEQGDLQANMEPICEILSASGIEESMLENQDVLSALINTLYDFHLENGGAVDLEIERFRALHEVAKEYGRAWVTGSATLQ
ncbi:hypothetical protein [Saccharospirillum salsuginis]|uniref:Uncharacterized protein n=1 Tax=Saccharospirillum salsuginis TaxID=418750 RepID=A0A918NG96_9GAMM|nr:hypothetical protein [Saccharospirillum salsuginis]GGX65236.1 hypothetical protein GCM10007392_36380 [Saccharospirillum salsuginis]